MGCHRCNCSNACRNCPRACCFVASGAVAGTEKFATKGCVRSVRLRSTPPTMSFRLGA
jgi:hypothetical protein